MCVPVVALHVAGREEEHRRSSGVLPALANSEDLQVPAPAQGTLRGFPNERLAICLLNVFFLCSILCLSV